MGFQSSTEVEGRPLSKREEFEKKEKAKVTAEIEEEDHQEDVSFEVPYMYPRLIIGSFIFFAGYY